MQRLPLPIDFAGLGQLLWDAADQRASHPAIVERERVVTYEELRSAASRIAAALGSCQLRPGDRVAVLLERGADAAAAIFGIYAAGGVAVVLNERFRPRQIEYALNHCGARVLLTQTDILVRQPRTIVTSAEMVDISLLRDQAPFVPLPRAAGDLAQIIYTSGSTGFPKGVVFSHGSLQTGVGGVVEYLGLTGEDRIAGLLPFSSVYGLNQLLCSIHCGAALLVELSPVPQRLIAGLREASVTILAAVPPLWLQLLSVPEFRARQIPTLRILQNAGGHLPVDAVHRLREAQPQARLFLQYGQTETFRSTFLSPEETEQHPDSIGRPVPNAEVFVMRDDGTPCEPGEVGELIFSGCTVAQGYWNDAETTSRTFRAHPTTAGRRVVYSGDLVRRDAAGRLYFVSRRDRVISTLGYRVGPDELIDVLFGSRQVAEAVLATEPDPQRGDRVTAYVVLTSDGSLERLEAYCRTELPRYMQPSRIEVRSALPRLASGKYDMTSVRATIAS
jgi:acyl-CoA synthetase (AMP-forming)/AMP-acid ligase II